jgi:gamma-glutamyltranspeptidase
MAVGISLERRSVVATWTEGLVPEEKVILRFSRVKENGETDVSNTDERANDGEAAVTVPYDFSGTTHLDVVDAAGNIIDSGDLEV